MRPTERVRIVPILMAAGSAVASAVGQKVRYNGQGDFDILCNLGCKASTGQRVDTAALCATFVVTESTAATVAGSAITGAKICLGAATVNKLRGALSFVMNIATNAATTLGITIDGQQYLGSAVGATAANAGVKIANCINGLTTAPKLKNYIAIANYTSKGKVLVCPENDMASGIALVEASAAGAELRLLNCQGKIHISAGKLSTHSPKYIGVEISTMIGSTVEVHSAHMVTYPSMRSDKTTPGLSTYVTT